MESDAAFLKHPFYPIPYKSLIYLGLFIFPSAVRIKKNRMLVFPIDMRFYPRYVYPQQDVRRPKKTTREDGSKL